MATSFNFAQIPLVGALFARGQTLLSGGVQHIKEQIATFHLVPRNIQNYRARADRLSQLTVVNASTDDVATVLDAKRRTDALASQYDTVNKQVDTALASANSLASGAVSLSAAANVATAAAGINDVLSAARTIDNKLASVERRVLAPQQLAGIGSFGVAATPGTTINTKTVLIGAAIVGGILLMQRRRR